MHTFDDANGLRWTVNINVATIKKVRALLNVDLVSLLEDSCRGLSELLSDPVKLADVLYCLCKDEADKREISDEKFGEALVGDVIMRAAEAFVNELVEFFPDPKVRSGLKKVLDISKQLREQIINQAYSKIETIDIDEEVKRLIS